MLLLDWNKNNQGNKQITFERGAEEEKERSLHRAPRSAMAKAATAKVGVE